MEGDAAVIMPNSDESIYAVWILTAGAPAAHFAGFISTGQDCFYYIFFFLGFGVLNIKIPPYHHFIAHFEPATAPQEISSLDASCTQRGKHPLSCYRQSAAIQLPAWTNPDRDVGIIS